MPGPATWAVIAAITIANVLTFGAFFIDKRRAGQRGARRIAEATLLGLGVLGPLGAWTGVLVLRHKTRKPWFLGRLLLASAVVPALVVACVA